VHNTPYSVLICRLVIHCVDLLYTFRPVIFFVAQIVVHIQRDAQQILHTSKKTEFWLQSVTVRISTDSRRSRNKIVAQQSQGQGDSKIICFEKPIYIENFISQVTHQITISTIIINYNGRLPERANAHQRWPPSTQ